MTSYSWRDLHYVLPNIRKVLSEYSNVRVNAFILKVVFGRYSEVRSEQHSDVVEMLFLDSEGRGNPQNILKLNTDVVEIRL